MRRLIERIATGFMAAMTFVALSATAMPPAEQRRVDPDDMPQQQMMLPADEPRFALVISQTDYANGLSRIGQAAEEGDMIAQSLSELGFAIDRRYDLTKAELATALDDFRIELERAGPDAVGFIYYTGHGAQHPETQDSYLLGVDAKLRVASDLAVYGLDMSTQRDGLAATRAKAVFMVFDACRNTGGLEGYKTTTKGLSRVEAKADMLIAYATGLGDVAQEGVYAPILAEELRRPGVPAETAFSNAQRRVAESTGREQLPWTNNLLYNTVCFAGCGATTSAVVSQPSSDPSTPTRAVADASLSPSELAARAALSGMPVGDRMFSDCVDCPDMIVIPPGKFMMGSPRDEDGRYTTEGPQREVTIMDAFAMSTTEVTWDQWDACTAEGGCDGAGPRGSGDDEGYGKGNRPVINVTREDARDYAAWLSQKTGATYRLPTEAEWEYAARADSEAAYSFGPGRDAVCTYGNVKDEAYRRDRGVNIAVEACDDGAGQSTADVGSYKANAFGLFDMHGNVFEWVEDDFSTDGYTESHPTDGTAYASGNRNAAGTYRGGSFQSGAKDFRSATRRAKSPASRDRDLGFRVVRELR